MTRRRGGEGRDSLPLRRRSVALNILGSVLEHLRCSPQKLMKSRKKMTTKGRSLDSCQVHAEKGSPGSATTFRGHVETITVDINLLNPSKQFLLLKKTLDFIIIINGLMATIDLFIRMNELIDPKLHEKQ